MNPPTIANLPFPDLDLIFVEGGKFMMGDEVGDSWETCRPVHPVKVSSFYMARFPVTQRLYQAVVGSNPSYFIGNLRPVETVSWKDAQEFIEKLNGKKAAKDFIQSLNPLGKEFRLPTEAEWEFSARGGRFPSGMTKYAGSDKLKEVGWYDDNSYGETKPVGLKYPNELGLYDMSGNVWEWCEDLFDSNYYKKCAAEGLAINPLGPEKGSYRVLRGSGYFDNVELCRSALRDDDSPVLRSNTVGFRLVVSSQSVD